MQFQQKPNLKNRLRLTVKQLCLHSVGKKKEFCVKFVFGNHCVGYVIKQDAPLRLQQSNQSELRNGNTCLGKKGVFLDNRWRYETSCIMTLYADEDYVSRSLSLVSSS